MYAGCVLSRRAAFPDWAMRGAAVFSTYYKLSMLGLESQQVIALRLMKLALGGPAASAEAQRMVAEKMSAAAGASMKLARGGSADSVIDDYRKTVRRNLKRLSKR